MDIGVAYGIWAASGVARTALASRILFNEPLTKVISVGIGLIIAGVLFIELGAAGLRCWRVRLSGNLTKLLSSWVEAATPGSRGTRSPTS
ncbi:DMT family transporter [Saccharopolyspora spinosa]|uniref:Small Multidrug Resistance (SMR) protein n=2 Tax=Saccharopolyspora spinosa TaxID=60894 RepID=A0A2N3XSK9_SACSN|nr:SMR family transporter [Saccharopolyspora spinosa]PKW13678.1 Small Multidrug Resistance (SMR) protein [Saccharopolyspora spinosa]